MEVGKVLEASDSDSIGVKASILALFLYTCNNGGSIVNI